MTKKIAVILSGCGVYDGSEIHESVITLLNIDKQGANYSCFAPNKSQLEVIDHITGKLTTDSRNVLQEAARIARGNIDPTTNLKIQEFDALIIPGGLGAIKNLSDFAKNKEKLTVDQSIENIIKNFIKAEKPVGLICISPVLAGKIFPANTIVTIGQDEKMIATVEAMGLQHKICSVDEIAVDEKNKLVTTPAYMLAKTIKEAACGIEKLVEKIISMVN